MGLILGTAFLQVDDDQAGASLRAAALFFAVIISNLLSMRMLLQSKLYSLAPLFTELQL